MHHAAAENFEPVLAFAEADLAAGAAALDVDLHRGRGEGKEARPETHPDLRDLEERLAELLEHPFEVGERRAPIDHQALDLVEHRRMGLVEVGAVGAAGADHADRRLLGAAWCAPAPGSCACAGACARRSRRARGRTCRASRAPGGPGGKLSLVKLKSSLSMSGPSATEKPMSAKMATISSVTWLIGWMRPVSTRGGRHRQGEVERLAFELGFERGLLEYAAARRQAPRSRRLSAR